MADDIKIERTVDDKGRRIEIRTFETVVDGKKERVTETYVEQVPLEMSERIVEEISPVITTRKKEIFKAGKKVDAVVESIYTNMVEVQQPVRQEEILTKADLMSALQELFNSQMNTRLLGSGDVKMLVEPKTLAETPKVEVPVAPETPKVEVPVAPKTETAVWEYVETGAYMVLSAELAFCVYHLVLRNWL